MSPSLRDTSVYVEWERKPATEDLDIAEIVRALLAIQARNAREQKAPLARGTHSKGCAVRAEFEVLNAYANGRDPAISARLAKGIFAHPGVYPAIIRFANAESKSFPDSHPDVRALSFHIQVPPGLVGPGVSRLDFSTNSATTFPMNDARAFAVFVRISSSLTKWAMAKTFWSLPIMDSLGFFQTAFRAVIQQRRTPRVGYQQLRYWSTVPFRQGTGDVIKYGLNPSPANTGEVNFDDYDGLRDDLARQLTPGGRMPEFDFGLQFLDVESMTFRGRKRDPAFWVENASYEWNEDQAPFHTIARLRLLPDSMLTPEATAAQYIDVTENSIPDNLPIGGLNRTRWAAENASRTARQGGIVDVPAAVPVRRSRISSLIRWSLAGLAGLFFLALFAGILYRWAAGANIPPLEHVDNVRYLDQGWGAGVESPGREQFYYTPQGSSLLGIRYSWFLNVERPFRSTRLADPDHMRQLNFIVDPVPTRSNPDLLPVGLAKHYDAGMHDYVVDITCAACHTGQLNVTVPSGNKSAKTTTTAIRIDGGQSMIAFTDAKMGSLLLEIIGSFATTAANPIKFNRFANRVLGTEATIPNKFRLWRQVVGVVGDGVTRAGFGSFRPGLYPTQEGFGRTDAIGRISNVVFGDHIDPANYRVARGPASYPYLWNIWKFDWEQYGAFVSQPMARNLGEALGTGADYRLLDAFGRPLPQAERYRTSFMFENVERIESDLQTLRPPVWPEDLLGKIDLNKAAKGRNLFVQHCQGCHGPSVASRALTHMTAPGRVEPNSPPLSMWLIETKPLADIGTDPVAAENLSSVRVDLTRTGLELAAVQALLKREIDEQGKRAAAMVAAAETSKELEAAKSQASGSWDSLVALQKLDLRSVSIGEGLNILGMVIRERYYADNHFSPEAQACFNGFGMLDLPQAEPGYKPRPLEGVWATPPFLHNGSVPTLYHLLSPVKERPASFYVGSREFDPARVGYMMPVDDHRRGEFRLDTSVMGNSNRGHEFNDGYIPWDPNKPAEAQYQNGLIGPKLTEEERWALVEYLKIHRDDVDVIQYVGANNGKYPVEQPAKFPDCFKLLGKGQ